MDNFTKVVRFGTSDLGYLRRPVSIFAKIEYKDGELSICGVEGPTPNGNAKGGCGQITLDSNNLETAPGWQLWKVAKFQKIWERWHLNHMRAGSPAQSAYLRVNPITDRLDWYGSACKALEAVGLNPDPSYPQHGKEGSPLGYKFGSAWLQEQVPEPILQWLRELPDTDVTPAWV